MKAKAMKKTLSCILALSLTASMMAENLTAIAANDGFGGTNIAGAQPGTLEEDSAPDGIVVTESDFDDLATVWGRTGTTSGKSTYLDEEFNKDSGTFYQVSDVKIVDSTGAEITTDPTVFVDGELNEPNANKAFKNYYAKITFSSMSITETTNQETGKVTAVVVTPNVLSEPVYVPLNLFGYNSTLTSEGETKAKFGLYNATNKIEFANDQTDITTGFEDVKVGLFLDTLEYDETHTGDADSGITDAVIIRKANGGADQDIAAAKKGEAEIDLKRLGVEKIQFVTTAGKTYYENSPVKYAFSDAKYQLKWNNKDTYETAQNLYTDGKIAAGFTVGTVEAGVLTETPKLGETSGLAWGVEYDPTGVEADKKLDGFVGSLVSETATITLDEDAIKATSLVSASWTDTDEDENVDADEVSEATAAALPKYQAPFDTQMFYTGANAIKFEHFNGTVDYLVGVPTFSSGALESVAWYTVNGTTNEARLANLYGYVDKYNTAAEAKFAEAFPGTGVTENLVAIAGTQYLFEVTDVDSTSAKEPELLFATKALFGTYKEKYTIWVEDHTKYNDVNTAVTNIKNEDAIRPAFSGTGADKLRLDVNDDLKVTVSYKGADFTTDAVTEDRLFNWDDTTCASIATTQVYTGEKLTDLLNENMKLSTRDNPFETATTTAFITKDGTGDTATYTLAAGKTLLIVEKATTIATSESVYKVKAVYYKASAPGLDITDEILPEGLDIATNAKDTSITYTYEIYAVNGDAGLALGDNPTEEDLENEKFTSPYTLKIADDALTSNNLVLTTKDADKITNAGAMVDIPDLTKDQLEAKDGGTGHATKFYTGTVVLKAAHLNKDDQLLVAVPTFNAGTGAVDSAAWYAVDAEDDLAAVNTYVTAFNDNVVKKNFAKDNCIAFNATALDFVMTIGLNSVAAPAFSTDTDVGENSYVTYNNKIYKCKKAGGHTGNWDGDDFEEVTAGADKETFAAALALNPAAAAACAFDVEGSEKNINVAYNKTAQTMTVTYRGATIALDAVAASAIDFTTAAKTAIGAVEVYPGDSIFDVIKKDMAVEWGEATGNKKSMAIVNYSDATNPVINDLFAIVLTQVETAAGGNETSKIVAVYDKDSKDYALTLPVVPEATGKTYTYKVSVVKDNNELQKTAKQEELLAARTAGTNDNETNLVSLALVQNSIESVALATSADSITGLATTLPDIKYGGKLTTGKALVKVTHKNDYEEFILAVPVYVGDPDYDEETKTWSKIEPNKYRWVSIHVTEENATKQKTAIADYFTAYTKLETDLAAAKAMAEDTADKVTAKETAYKNAIDAFKTAANKLYSVINFCGEFAATHPAYAVDDLITKDNKLYKVKAAIAADEAWDDANVTEVTLANNIVGFKGNFNAANAYAIGDVVQYTDGKLYKFKAAHAVAGWNNDHVNDLPVVTITGLILDETIDTDGTKTDAKAAATMKNKDKLYAAVDAKQNPGSVTFTYKGASSEAIPVTVSGATVGAIQGEIGARVTDKNQTTKYNASYVLKMTADANQNALPDDAVWTPGAKANVYSVPEAGDNVFYFNYSTSFTDDDLIATIKEGDASIAYTLNDGAPITKDLKKGLTDGTFGVISETPISAAGAQWLGFWYKDTTNKDATAGTTYTKVNFYLPVFVGNNLKEPVIKTKTAVQKYYYKGETFNPNGIKVDLKDYYSYQIADKDADLELKDLDAKYWSVYFNNGVTKTPSVADGVVNAALTAASVAARIGSIVVYNAAADICGFIVNEGLNPAAELKFTDNYVKTISIDVDNIKSKYQVGYYPDNTILHQAALPTVEKITKGAVLKVSFANKSAQADVEIPFSTFAEADELDGRMHVKKVLTGGKTLEGDIIVTALSGVTTGGKATPGKNATYRVTFVPGVGGAADGNQFVSDDTIAPVTVTVSTEQVAIKSVGLYDGTTIAADDYYVEANPAATADGAEKCTPTTQFYVGEDVDADTVTHGFTATRDDGDNIGSFLVTYTDGKKQLVQYNADGVDFPTVDSSTEQASRKVSFTYEVEEQKGYYEGYKTVAPIELNVSILQDEILSFDVDDAQGTIVFYQGDTDRTLFEHIQEADGKVVEIDDDDEYFITAIYKNRGNVPTAFDLLDSTEFRHFTYADSDFDTITATTGDKTLTYTYSQNGKDIELKLPIKVLEKPVDLTIKNPTRTVFEKTEVVSLDGGALTLEIGGQDSVKKTFTLNDILSNSDELGDYKGRFQVVDDKNNVITDKTISNLGDGYHTLTFKFYRTVPNDENKVATATLNVSLIDAYVADLYLDPAATDTSTLLTSYVGSPINFKDHAIKYTLSDALSTAKTLNLATVPIYSTDEDGNPTQTIINGVAKSSLTGILKNAYMTVTTQVKQKNGTYKTVTDYGDKTSNVFGLAGTHHVHIQLDDKAIDFDVDVKAVVPTAFTLTGGTAPKYGDASGNQYVGQELAFTAGTGTVKFIDGTTKTVNLATDKNIFIHVDETTGNSTFDKDTLGLQHVQLDYVVDGTTVTTASGELDITVLADTVSTVALTVNGSAVSSTNPITFFVGDTATAFNEYQNIGATFTMKSGATIKVDNVAKSDLNKYFSFTALTDTKTTTEIPLREMSVKYGKDAASTITVGTVYYQVETDDLAAVTPTANTYFDEGSENKLKTSVYLAGNATVKGDGFYFDATFESGRTAKKIDLGNLPTGYTIAILKADGTQVVADTAKATAAEKALLTAGVYVLGINYSATTDGTTPKSTALTKALPLVTTNATGDELAGPKASVTYVAATAYAKELEVTTAPTGFGNSKAKITVNQYSYANAAAFVDALKGDDTFAITAYADNDTTGFATGKKGAWDGWTFDASGIDFTKDSPYYTLKVTYQDATASIPVTVDARTIKSLTANVGENTITLGVGEIWDGKFDNDTAVKLRVKYSDDNNGAEIDLAKEIELGEKSKVDIDYDTSDAGAAKIIVTYEGATCTLDATVVEPTALENLYFLVKPDKLTYKINEKPVLDGAIVVGRFDTAVVGFTYEAIVTLSALKDLDFGGNETVGWTVTVGKFDWSWIGGAEEDIGAVVIADHADAKQTEKDKKFVLEVSTPKSINVKDAQLTYYLKYTGKYAKNTADNRLLGEITDNKIPNKDKLKTADNPNGIALSKSAVESQAFDASKGTLTISYLDSDTDQVIPFENNVSGSTGAAPIRVKINGIAEAEPTLPTAEGMYGVEVSYYETADVTAAGVKTTSYTLNVAQDEVTGFTLTPPDDTEVIQGGAINLTGAKAELIFKSGRKADPIQLTSEAGKKMFKVSKVNQSLVDQKQTITVQYYEYDDDGNEIAVGTPAEFEITLKKNIARSIAISRRPKNKFIYNTSDTDYNFEGGELEVTWEKAIDEEGNKTQIFKMDELYADKTSGFEVEAVDFTEAVTDKVITISYLGQKTTFLLTVDPDPITGIKESTQDPITKKIALDSKLEDFVKTGSVVISYELGEDKEVKLSDEHIKIEGWDVSKPQEVDLYITYTEGKYKSEKLKVTVAVGMNVVTGITFDDDTSAKTVKLTVGDTLTLADYSLKIAYEDAEAKTTTLANADGLLTVTAYKVDGETETLVEAIDTSAVGTYKIKAVSSEDKTSKAGATLTVEVEAVKVGEIKPANEVIRITTKDDLSLEAEKVTVKYTSGAGSTAELTLGTNTKIAYTITDASGNAVEKINPETEGTYTVKITSKEDTTYAGAEITVIVSDTTITDFKLSETAKTINKGDTLSLAGITATVTYSKGEPKSYDLATATAKELKVDTSAVKTSEPGTYNVVVTLWEDPSKTATIAVTVTDVKVKSIEVADVTLTDGKKFDPAAIDAKITLDDAAATTETVKLNSTKLSYTIADATGAAVTEIDPTKAATYTVTVKSTVDAAFAGATFKVTVSVVTITDAKLTPPAKLEFKTGEVVGYGDAKMTVTYSDNTTKEFKLADGTGLTITITDAAGTEIEDITKIDTTKAGVYTVKVSVTGDNRVPESFTITIVDANKITDEDIEIPEETPTIDSRVVTFTKNGDSWTQGAGAATLTDAFKAIGNGSGDYMFVVSGNITEESALKLPSKATGITIVGEGTVTLNKASTFNVKTADISINCPISGTLNVTVGKGKTLKVGENVKALGAIKGDATSKIDFIGEGAVTVGSISKAAEVYAESGRVITMSGNKAKVQNVAKIKAEFALSDGAAISSSAFEEGIVTIKGEKTKVTITDATTKFLDIIIDAEDKALTSGTAVLFGNGRFDPSTNVVIRNKDSEGNKLSAVAYNKNKEVRAENIELISYTIGEDGEEQNISSFEALFDKLNTITGDVFVTLNGDAEISKAAKYPTKFTGKLSIDGNGYKINSLGLSALAPKGDLTIKNLAALTVKGENKFVVKGLKNKTLTLEDNSAEFAQITGFTNVVADSVIVTNKFQVTNLTLSGLFVVQNVKAAVTVENLTIVDDGAFGFVATEKKQKTITVKKTVTKDADAKVVLIMVTKSGDVYEEDDTKSMTTGATVFTDSAKKLALIDVDATGLKAGGTGSVTLRNGKFTVA